MKITKYILLTLEIFFITFFSIGCKKDKVTDNTNNENQISKTEQSDYIDELSQDFVKGKNILVILGHGYNTEKEKEEIINTMSKKFGVEKKGENGEIERNGFVSILTYPEDFMDGKYERITLLDSLTKDRELCGMIILGAPERTYKALAMIQDKCENGKTDYPIFTFFSQDDILGTESSADLVFDYAQKVEDTLTDEKDNSENIDITDIIGNIIQLILTNKVDFSDTEAIAKKIIGEKHKLSRYIDTESGIKSKNHFIFE